MMLSRQSIEAAERTRTSLLKQPIAKIKKKCKSLKLSAEGSNKRDLVNRIINKTYSTEQKEKRKKQSKKDTKQHKNRKKKKDKEPHQKVTNNYQLLTLKHKANNYDTLEIEILYILSSWFKLIEWNNDYYQFLFHIECISLIKLYLNHETVNKDKWFQLHKNHKKKGIKGIEYKYHSFSGDSGDHLDTTSWNLRLYINNNNVSYDYFHHFTGFMCSQKEANGGIGKYKIYDNQILCVKYIEKESKQLITKTFEWELFAHLADENKNRSYHSSDNITYTHLYIEPPTDDTVYIDDDKVVINKDIDIIALAQLCGKDIFDGLEGIYQCRFDKDLIINKELKAIAWNKENNGCTGIIQIYCKNKIVITQNGSINADGCGYYGDYSVGSGSLSGSYGTVSTGEGERDKGRIYGTQTLDILYLGSGSKESSHRQQDPGGGIIQIITKHIINKGIITCKGKNCGSGGSIKIIAETFENYGTVCAAKRSETIRVGGDGRIAIYSQYFQHKGTIYSQYVPQPFIAKDYMYNDNINFTLIGDPANDAIYFKHFIDGWIRKEYGVYFAVKISRLISSYFCDKNKNKWHIELGATEDDIKYMNEYKFCEKYYSDYSELQPIKCVKMKKEKDASFWNISYDEYMKYLERYNVMISGYYRSIMKSNNENLDNMIETIFKYYYENKFFQILIVKNKDIIDKKDGLMENEIKPMLLKQYTFDKKCLNCNSNELLKYYKSTQSYWVKETGLYPKDHIYQCNECNSYIIHRINMAVFKADHSLTLVYIIGHDSDIWFNKMDSKSDEKCAFCDGMLNHIGYSEGSNSKKYKRYRYCIVCGLHYKHYYNIDPI